MLVIAAWAIKDRGTFHGLVKKVDSLRYVSETKTSKNYIDLEWDICLQHTVVPINSR